MKKLLLFLFTTVLSLNAMAQGLTYEIKILPPSGVQKINNTNIEWEVNEDWTLTIRGEGKIPNFTDDAPWHQANYTEQTEIYIDGIHRGTIEKEAGKLTTKIKKIIIAEDITHIGNRAFFSLENLTSVELPTTLTSIGEDAFNGCSKLSTLNEDCNWNEISLDATSFSGTGLIRNNGALYIGGKLIRVYEAYEATELEIEAGTTEICANAFKDNTKVTSISIPFSVRKIGDNAFYGCDHLLDFTLNTNNVTFGSNVFAGCSSLPSDEETETYRKAGDNIIVEVYDTDEEIYQIPSDIIYIADNAFVNCKNVKTIKCASTPAMATNALSNNNEPYLYVEDGNEDKFLGKGISRYKINYTDINLHSSGYSTIALDHSAIIPDGVEAYTVTSDGTTIHYKRVTGNKLAKGTGYFIVGTGKATFEPAKESIAEGNNNNLVGVTEKTGVRGSDIYFLSTTDGVTGFFCLGDSYYEFPANKAYLQVSGTIGNAQYFLVNLDETETRIDNTESEEKTSHSRNNVYNLAGQKMSHPQKGINIVNGKLTIM